MKISDELASRILSVQHLLRLKFGISIGYSHPCGDFIDDDKNVFVIIKDGQFSDKIGEVEYGDSYIVEFNKFQTEVYVFFRKNNFDLEQKSDKISDFLIDFHKWWEAGELELGEKRVWGKYSYQDIKDGRFDVCEDHGCYMSGYMRYLDDLPEDLREHILSEKQKNDICHNKINPGADHE